MKAKAILYGMDVHNQFILSPDSDEDFKSMLKMKGYINLESWSKRDIDKHKQYFALIKATIYHTSEAFTMRFGTIDKMRHQLMVLSGNCDMIENLDGTKSYKPHSIKFKNMDDEKFKVIYKDCLDAAVHFFLKDISYEDFKTDILNFYGRMPT